MKISRIDHLVMTVKNIERTCAFYESVLGLKTVTFDTDRKALQLGEQKLNLHEQGHEFEPKAAMPAPGAIDLCVITDTPIDLVLRELQEKQIPIEAGPVKRTGAMGQLMSVYLRDPDHNLIEISQYSKEGS